MPVPVLQFEMRPSVVALTLHREVPGVDLVELRDVVPVLERSLDTFIRELPRHTMSGSSMGPSGR